jgi:type I restriction enzyme R subunit
MTNEAFSRVKIDAQLKDQGWETQNPNAVRFEYVLPDGTKADYVLCDRNGRSLAVIEAKRASVNPPDAAAQAKAYAVQLKVPFIFLSNGDAVRFWDWENEAHPRAVKTFFGPEDLERRFATRVVRRDPRFVPIDHRIVERDYQTDCIEVLTGEFQRGRRKMLVDGHRDR